jgi:hypothetical protein
MYHRPCSMTPAIPLGHGLQMHLQIPYIAASKVTTSWPTSSIPFSFKYRRQVGRFIASNGLSNLAWVLPLSSHHLGLHVYPQTASSLASNDMAVIVPQQSRSVFLSSLNHHLGPCLELLPSTTCTQFKYTMCEWIHFYLHENTHRIRDVWKSWNNK